MVPLYGDAEKLNVIENVRLAAERVIASPEFLPYIPRVGTKVVMALSHASSPAQVVALQGLISRSTKVIGAVRFGVSSHMARVVLAVMKFDPALRAALNLRYVPELVDAFRRAGYRASRFSLVPEKVKVIEYVALVQGVEQVVKRIGRVPDAIFDVGEFGRAPMMRVLGVSATEAVKKALVAIRDLEFNKQIHL